MAEIKPFRAWRYSDELMKDIGAQQPQHHIFVLLHVDGCRLKGFPPVIQAVDRFQGPGPSGPHAGDVDDTFGVARRPVNTLVDKYQAGYRNQRDQDAYDGKFFFR